MKYQIRCPPIKIQESLKLLLCIDEKYPDVVLVRKLERILSDLDYIYVNLLKIIKNPEYELKIRPKNAITSIPLK
jgi:hypothetical protein